MRRMKKAGQYLLGIFAALLLCGVFSVNIVKAESQYVYDNASLLSDEEEQDLERSCTEFERNTKLHMRHPDRAQQWFRGLSGDCR